MTSDMSPLIKVTDIAYVRFRAPDLDLMASFLTDFGMSEVARIDDTLYMRGTGPDPYVHITEKGEAGFVGPAFQAETLADLETLAAATGTAVEDHPGPCGGKRLVLSDPDGFPIEVVYGATPHPELESRFVSETNNVQGRPRINDRKEVGNGPSKVHRLGHCVLDVTNYTTSATWYRHHFGLLISDEIFVGDEENVFGAFMRCDRGDLPVDHHTLFLVGTGAKGFNHAAWEVDNFDDLMCGHQVLKDKGHTPVWGIGRHILGSQIFDYWRDPWGHKVEHWTDGDLFKASHPPALQSVEKLTGTHWGETTPPAMME